MIFLPDLMDRVHLLSVPVSPVTTSLVRVHDHDKSAPHLQERHQLSLAQERFECADLSNLSLSPSGWHFLRFLPQTSTFTGENTAPSGITPCSRYFHSAINTLRASATMPTRRMR